LQSPTRQIPKYEKNLFPEILALAKSEKALELANQAMEKQPLNLFGFYPKKHAQKVLGMIAEAA
jgi:hypothetical protein